MTDLGEATPQAPTKLSDESGFISFDISRPHYTHRFPSHTAGLVAFLFAEEGSEMVLKILMCEDIAKGFLENRLFCGRANMAAYRVFEPADNYDARAGVLAERLKLYAQLIEKYDAPQTRLL